MINYSTTKEAWLYYGGKTIFLITGFQENWTLRCKRIKLDHCFTSRKKINSKWIKDLNVRPQTIKLLEENIGQKLYGIGFGGILHMTPKEQAAKENREIGPRAS